MNTLTEKEPTAVTAFPAENREPVQASPLPLTGIPVQTDDALRNTYTLSPEQTAWYRADTSRSVPPPVQETEDEPEPLPEQNEFPPQTDEDLPRYVLPLPVPPEKKPDTPVGETEARNRYWAGLLTGRIADIPAELRDTVRQDTPGMAEEETDYRTYALINRSHVVDTGEFSREDVTRNWTVCRRKLADSMSVPDSEEDVYLGLSDRRITEENNKLAADIYEQAYMAGLSGKEEYDIEATHPGLTGKPAAAALQIAEDAFRKGAEDRDKHLKDAVRIADAVELARKADRWYAAAVVDFDMFADAVNLNHLSEKDRQITLHLARSLMSDAVSPDDVPWWDSALRSVSRSYAERRAGLSHLKHSVKRSVTEGLSRLSNKLGWDRAEEKFREMGRQDDEKMRLAETLRRLIRDELEPLDHGQDVYSAQRFINEVSPVLADTALSFHKAMRSILPAVDFASTIGHNVAESSLQKPDDPEYLRLVAGAAGAAAQYAFSEGISRIGRNRLQNSIFNAVRRYNQKAAGAGRTTLQIGSSLGLQTTRDTIAGILARFGNDSAQVAVFDPAGIADSIRWQVSCVDADDLKHTIWEAGQNLLPILLSNGHLHWSDVRAREKVLSKHGGMLDQWGIDADTKRLILAEGDVEQQGELIRNALRQSKRMTSPDFIHEEAQALRLLNTEDFRGFSDENFVRDFLDLPETKVPGGKEPRRRSTENRKREKAWGESQKLYESWLKATENDSAETNSTGVPLRMLRNGTYAPYAETERRNLFNEGVDAVRRTSYNMLLNSFTPDSLTAHAMNGVSPVELAQRMQNRYNGVVVDAVMRIAMGEDRQTVLRQAGESTAWLMSQAEDGNDFSKVYTTRPVPTEQGLLFGDDTSPGAAREKPLPPPEGRSVRVAEQTRNHIALLADLLPHLDDVYTGMSRGMSYLQAQDFVLRRSLPVDEKLVEFSYRRDFLPKHPQDMSMDAYLQDARSRYDLYRRLTGCQIETHNGENGKTLYRILRPDGHYTCWHESEDMVMRDLVANTMPLSYPLGDGTEITRRQRSKIVRRFSAENRFSGIDQLGGRATQDLLNFWMGNDLCMQAGMKLVDNRMSVAVNSPSHASAPIGIRRSEKAGDFNFDRVSMRSPLAVLQARSYVYWSRALTSGSVSFKDLQHFLVSNGLPISSALSKVNFSDTYTAPPGTVDKSRIPHKIDVRNMSQRMSDFTVMYTLAYPDRVPLPVSVRRWIASVPFAPRLQNGKDARRVVVSRLHEPVMMQWGNRMAGEELRAIVPEVEAVRALDFAEDGNNARVMNHLKRALGMDTEQQSEQGWMISKTGHRTFMHIPQRLWNLLLTPTEAWNRLGRDGRADLVHALAQDIQKYPHLFPEPAEQEPTRFFRSDTERSIHSRLKEMQDVYKMYPELRKYDIPNPSEELIRRMDIDSPREEPAVSDEPVQHPLSLPVDRKADRTVRSIENAQLPADLLSDKRVMPALRLMSELRRYIAEKPYRVDDGVFWRGKLYGGRNGKNPPGLEEWHVDRQPLAPLLRIFRQIESDPVARAQLKVLGVNCDDLNTADINLTAFDSTTVYRHSDAFRGIYRLMSGAPDAANQRMLTPYLVHSRSGIYQTRTDMNMGDSSPISVRSVRNDADIGAAILPFEKFRGMQERYRDADRSRDQQRLCSEHTLRSIIREGIDLNNHAESVAANHTELLMRLCVDNGFTRSLSGRDAMDLSEGEALTVKLAYDLMVCAANPDSYDALRRLGSNIESLRASRDKRDAIIRKLTRAAVADGEGDTGVKAESKMPVSTAELFADDRRRQRAEKTKQDEKRREQFRENRERYHREDEQAQRRQAVAAAEEEARINGETPPTRPKQDRHSRWEFPKFEGATPWERHVAREEHKKNIREEWEATHTKLTKRSRFDRHRPMEVDKSYLDYRVTKNPDKPAKEQTYQRMKLAAEDLSDVMADPRPRFDVTLKSVGRTGKAGRPRKPTLEEYRDNMDVPLFVVKAGKWTKADYARKERELAEAEMNKSLRRVSQPAEQPKAAEQPKPQQRKAPYRESKRKQRDRMHQGRLNLFPDETESEQDNKRRRRK